MNLVDLLAAIGKLDVVTWRQKSAPSELVRISRRTPEGTLVLDVQKEDDGSWIEGSKTWDVQEFLRAFEPVR